MSLVYSEINPPPPSAWLPSLFCRFQYGSSCSDAFPENTFQLTKKEKLRPLHPGTKNSVSTQDGTLDPLSLSKHLSFETFLQHIEKLPGAHLITLGKKDDTPLYAHFIFLTPFWQFEDDVELLWHPETRQVDIRSGARVGVYDFDVNAKRIETLRDLSKKLSQDPD